MAPTRTVKNKHAARNSGIKGSKDARASARPDNGVVKSKRPKGSKGPVPVQTKKGRPDIKALLKKKRKVYSEKELDLPTLNMITPVGVEKPKGKKKGKVFVDDRESMTTILAMVQAEKEGQIESKMIKARQMEEIREARRVEAEKKDEERQARFDETKDSLRKKRKRPEGADEKVNIKEFASTGTKAAKPKKRKSVSFAET